jgi:CoA:oxalate CoA-transferase
MVENVLQTKSGHEWLEKLYKVGVPAGPINTIDRAFNDPHVIAREMIVELEAPSGEKIKTIGNPIKTTEMPARKFSPPPRLGEHTREVLSGILGYPSKRIDFLAKNGIIKIL